MSVNRTPYLGSYGGGSSQVPNPYQIDTPGGKEDISWILD